MEVAKSNINDYAYCGHIREVVVDAHCDPYNQHEHHRGLALIDPVDRHYQQREQNEEIYELPLNQRNVYSETAGYIAERTKQSLEIIEPCLPAENNKSEPCEVQPQDYSDRITKLYLACREERCQHQERVDRQLCVKTGSPVP